MESHSEANTLLSIQWRLNHEILYTGSFSSQVNLGLKEQPCYLQNWPEFMNAG